MVKAAAGDSDCVDHAAPMLSRVEPAGVPLDDGLGTGLGTGCTARPESCDRLPIQRADYRDDNEAREGAKSNPAHKIKTFPSHSQPAPSS